MPAKFKLRDKVITGDSTQGEIIEIFEPNAWRPQYRYRVYLLGSPGASAEIWEEDLYPMPDIAFDWESLCDCGSKHVYGFENCHAFWCQAYVKPEGDK